MMSNNLVIVESPAKVKTLKKFLGADYDVKASVGHVRDLPKSKLGVDVDSNYKPQYSQSADKAKVIKELKAAARSASRILLATDPDREGEAISWHLSEILEIPKDEPVRIQFNEITEKAVKDAIKNPRPIDMALVNAQQARRVLDRLVGYKLSPFLWKKVRRGLSAGRVQSAALNLICDREAEIEAFVPQEFWTIEALLEKSTGQKFTAKFVKGRTAKIEDPQLAAKVVEDCSKHQFIVTKVEKKPSQKRPSAPYITSTLQQDAYRKLGLTAKSTMAAAQQLYEGMEVAGQGHIAFITYMRTDSYRVSDEARKAAADFIAASYGKEYLPPKHRVYTTKAGAQDAHEAIRPVRFDMTPEVVKSMLSRDQLRLYRLIWNRFIASQMADMKLELTNISIDSAGHMFKAQGSRTTFDGFTKIYDYLGNGAEEKDEEQQNLPDLTEGELLNLVELKPLQRFTEPPARFTEGSLIKSLEEKGVGRPSTYATIIDTIKKREYVDIKERAFVPTSIGRAVCDVLKSNFQDIVNLDFTADMESKLDSIGESKAEWTSVIDDFYKPFVKKLADAEQSQTRVKIEPALLDEKCPECGRPLAVRRSKFGQFVGCSGYPECKYIKKKEKVLLPFNCPACGKQMEERVTKYRRKVYSCSGYPGCKFSTWKKPEETKCDVCGSFTVSYGRGKTKVYKCPNPGCTKYEPPKGKEEENSDE